MSFEEMIEELNILVSQLEDGNLTLDEALKKFENGISLIRASQKKLANAEQRINILLKNDDLKLSKFDVCLEKSSDSELNHD
ncbi:Exodeoxyribonuclease 7 small subunit [Candidatus Photodesmus katoptron]|nr:Exodeoxyribonuclease 7 small subunit [Candidatus Photodesmus katoptron]